MIEYLTGINWILMMNAFYTTLDVIEDGYVQWIWEIGLALFQTNDPILEEQRHKLVCVLIEIWLR
jgi:hypothetical protein